MTAALSISPVACWLVRCYQRYVSPYKGFCCAYRVLKGRDSCSQFASRAIARQGIAAGVRLTQRRFDRCRWASHVLEYDRARERRDRRERPLWCVNGCNPFPSTVEDAACWAAEGCLELPSIWH